MLLEAKKVFDILFGCEFVGFSVIGTKLRPLLRIQFSASESGRFSEIVTTVFGFGFREVLLCFLEDS